MQRDRLYSEEARDRVIENLFISNVGHKERGMEILYDQVTGLSAPLLPASKHAAFSSPIGQAL